MYIDFIKHRPVFIALVLALSFAVGYGWFISNQARYTSIDLAGLANVVDDCVVSDSNVDCIMLVYIWSPSMPLSKLGMKNASAGAEQLDHEIYFLQAETLTTKDQTQESQQLSEQLIAAGAHIHYPSIAIVINGDVKGTVITGYKNDDNYSQLLKSKVEGLISSAADGKKEGQTDSTTRLVSQSSLVDFETKIIAQVPGNVGAFVQSAGPNWITYDHKYKNYALSLESGEVNILPGKMDPIPSPDGKLLVTPGVKKRGLRIYQLQRDGENIDTLELLKDREMTDQYPTIGVLDQGEKHSDYRVLTSWYRGAKFKDYRVNYNNQSSAPVLTTLTPAFTACPEYNLSLPILSPDGQELAARDEDTGSTKLFRLRSGGQCDEILDLQLQTGKLAFSSDSKLLAFSIPRGTYRHGAGNINFPTNTDDLTNGVFVLDRNTRVMTKIMGGDKLNKLTFPQFISNNELLVMRYVRAKDRSSEFVSVCFKSVCD